MIFILYVHSSHSQKVNFSFMFAPKYNIETLSQSTVIYKQIQQNLSLSISNIQVTTIFVLLNLYYSLKKTTIQCILYIKNFQQSNMHRSKIQFVQGQWVLHKVSFNPPAIQVFLQLPKFIHGVDRQKFTIKFQCKCHHTEDIKVKLNPINDA